MAIQLTAEYHCCCRMTKFVLPSSQFRMVTSAITTYSLKTDSWCRTQVMRWSSRLPADSNGGDLPPALPALRRIGLNNFECEYVANPNMWACRNPKSDIG